ncbi:MAG: DUF6172 family protein [Stagnimonas sp.]|nr:DUF6172 family protein [Stagnimonas sp.]
MKKTFQLSVEGKNRDRVLDAVKHEIRKYVRRERRRDVPAGADYWDFDCRFGITPDTAEAAHLNSLIGLVDAAAREGADKVYVEILAKPGHRKARPAGAVEAEPGELEG